MRIKESTERRISAAMRIAMVVVLFLGNIALVALLSFYLQRKVAVVFVLLEVVGVIVAIRIQGTRGSPSYKLAWTIVVLTVPVTGLILYVLWGGSAQQKKQQLHLVPAPPHKDYERQRSLSYIERLGEGFPTWRRQARYLHKHDFMLYKNTAVTYFPDGESFFADAIPRIRRAEHFVFLEYFILAQGQIWDQIFAALKDRVSRGWR